MELRVSEEVQAALAHRPGGPACAEELWDDLVAVSPPLQRALHYAIRDSSDATAAGPPARSGRNRLADEVVAVLTLASRLAIADGSDTVRLVDALAALVELDVGDVRTRLTQGSVDAPWLLTALRPSASSEISTPPASIAYTPAVRAALADPSIAFGNAGTPDHLVMALSRTSEAFAAALRRRDVVLPLSASPTGDGPGTEAVRAVIAGACGSAIRDGTATLSVAHLVAALADQRASRGSADPDVCGIASADLAAIARELAATASDDPA